MKRIALLRHAKSDWDIGSPSDFERPVSERGHRNARRMARFIGESGADFTRAVVSPARRCRETFEEAAAEWSGDIDTEFDEKIYLASASNLLELVQEQPEECDSILVVGHNPGLTYLALELIQPDETMGERERIAEKFPTSAYVQLECDVDEWQDIGTAACRLVMRRYPSELRETA